MGTAARLGRPKPFSLDRTADGESRWRLMKQKAPIDETLVHGAQPTGIFPGQPKIHQPAIHMNGIKPMLQVVPDGVHGIASLGS